MKKFLMFLGVIFLGLIVFAVIGGSVLHSVGSRLDEESKLYVDEAIPAVVGMWDSQELLDRASPEFLGATAQKDVEHLFEIFAKRLGPLKEYRGPQGESNMFVDAAKGKIITAAYSAEAEFEKGPATIQMRIILRNDEWKILNFRVNSAALVP